MDVNSEPIAEVALASLAEIAQLLAGDVAEVAEALGAAWRPSPIGPAPDDQFLALVGSSTWVLGEPIQLVAAGTYSGRGIVLGRPLITMPLPMGPTISLADPIEVGSMAELRERAPDIRRLLVGRRRTFRYCRYCTRMTPPEEMYERSVCLWCAQDWLGVCF